jgi:hypothetical protein
MRMNELWKVNPGDEQSARMEDAGGPVLFVDGAVRRRPADGPRSTV